MCEGIPVFSNNKKAFHGTGTSSHSTAAEKLKIKEDHYMKSEYHWWDKQFVPDHYDVEGVNILRKNGVDVQLATKVAERYVKEHFKTNTQLWKWLTQTPGDFQRLTTVKDKKLHTYLFTKLTGYTPAENKKKLKEQEKKSKEFMKRVEKVQWFKPQETLKKRDISLKVDFALDLFQIPKLKIDFKWLETATDWDAARDAARGAARGAAWGAAWDAAWGAARDAAWDAAWGAAWGAARDDAWGAARGAAARDAAARDAAWGAARGAAARDAARGAAARDAAAANGFLISQDLKFVKGKYKKNPFMPLFELWEMGLYPVGVVGKKFVIYVPVVNGKKPVIK